MVFFSFLFFQKPGLGGLMEWRQLQCFELPLWVCSEDWLLCCFAFIYYLEFLVIIPLEGEKTNYALHLGKVKELHASFLIFLDFLKVKILVISAKRQFVNSHPHNKVNLVLRLAFQWMSLLSQETHSPNCKSTQTWQSAFDGNTLPNWERDQCCGREE